MARATPATPESAKPSSVEVDASTAIKAKPSGKAGKASKLVWLLAPLITRVSLQAQTVANQPQCKAMRLENPALHRGQEY